MFEQNGKQTRAKILEEKFETPTIKITLKTLIEMKEIVNECKDEVGWMMRVTHPDENTYIINKIYMLDQEVHATTCHISESAMTELTYKLIEENPEELNYLRGWGHSHVDMACEPSGQDDETFKEYTGECKFFIRIIANKKGKLRIDLADNERSYIYFNLPWEMIAEDDDESEIVKKLEYINMLKAEIEEQNKQVDAMYKSISEEIAKGVKEEVKDKVKKKSYSSHSTGWSGWTPDNYKKYYGYSEEVKDWSTTVNRKKFNIETDLDLEDVEIISTMKTPREVRDAIKHKDIKNASNKELDGLIELCEEYVEELYSESYYGYYGY